MRHVNAPEQQGGGEDRDQKQNALVFFKKNHSEGEIRTRTHLHTHTRRP